MVVGVIDFKFIFYFMLSMVIQSYKNSIIPESEFIDKTVYVFNFKGRFS